MDIIFLQVPNFNYVKSQRNQFSICRTKVGSILGLLGNFCGASLHKQDSASQDLYNSCADLKVVKLVIKLLGDLIKRIFKAGLMEIW